MNPVKMLIVPCLISAAILIPASAFPAADIAVKITPDIASVEVTHNGRKAVILRNQDQKNTVAQVPALLHPACHPGTGCRDHR
jgi:hypothetical protein